MTTSSEWLKIAGAVALPFVGSIPGGIVTKKNMDWYETLKKPSWRPPKWAFGPVWTSLYCSMGYASYLVYKESGGFQGAGKNALMLYGSSIILNWAWTPLFFGAKKIKLALLEMVGLWATIASTGYHFYLINPLAGYLFIPYLSWVTLATALTYDIWKSNPDQGQKKLE